MHSVCRLSSLFLDLHCDPITSSLTAKFASVGGKARAVYAARPAAAWILVLDRKSTAIRCAGIAFAASDRLDAELDLHSGAAMPALSLTRGICPVDRGELAW